MAIAACSKLSMVAEEHFRLPAFMWCKLMERGGQLTDATKPYILKSSKVQFVKSHYKIRNSGQILSVIKRIGTA